jgi:Gamma tubulin complex component C-terminal
MDYKPPPPLDVVITPGVLSKYQRIFSFILRLLRGKSTGSQLNYFSIICDAPV